MTIPDAPWNAGKTTNAPQKRNVSRSVVLPFGVKSLAIWIWLCAYLNCAGWFLSAIGQLNAIGYGVMLAIGAVVLWAWNHHDKSSRGPWRAFLKSLIQRFKRPFPLAFLVLAIMAFLGGALYSPTNYDALAYRLPRVLHWLAAGQWQWIHTDFPRLNNRACGIEWVSAPLIAILKTDRFFFLINFISFLFLPGLTFSVLTRLGVRRRVAWHWMWIAPSGYCFLLQAGSIGNDSFGAPFALAAIDFALRAKVSKRPGDLFCSILAAAVLTAAKTSNLPLLLPWAIAILPSLKILLQRPIATAGVCLLGISSSFLPTAVLNSRFCGDWSGLSLEYLQSHGSKPVRMGGNLALITVVNLFPPVFPQADHWNRFVQKVVPPHLNSELHQALTEHEAAEFHAEQMQIEENAGLGFGVTILLFVSAAVVFFCRKSFFQFQFHSFEALCETGIVLTPWVAALALLSKSEVYPIGRIMAPYYILFLPLLLRSPGHEQIIKKIWWRAAAFLVFVIAAGLLFISPARPLFPVGPVLAKIQAGYSNSKMLARVAEVYSVYHDRNHAFAPVLALLPPDIKVLGFIGYDDPETSLWQPFGSRRVVCVLPGDSPAYLKSCGVEYLVARAGVFGDPFPGFDDWFKKMNAQLIQTIPLNLRAATGPADWYLLKLN